MRNEAGVKNCPKAKRLVLITDHSLRFWHWWPPDSVKIISFIPIHILCSWMCVRKFTVHRCSGNGLPAGLAIVGRITGLFPVTCYISLTNHTTLSTYKCVLYLRKTNKKQRIFKNSLHKVFRLNIIVDIITEHILFVVWWLLLYYKATSLQPF